MAIKFLNTVQVDTDVLYVDTANDRVGIGTTSPQADFVVSHQDTSGIEIEANFQMGVNNILSFDRTAGALAYETMRLAAGDFWFTVLGIERMRIDASGNVGIGTTSPSAKLEISQQLSAAATIDYPYTISSRDDGNSINQVGGEGVGIKFRIAGNAATTPGDSLVGASIAAIRESSGDTDSSTGLGFFVTQNDETLDEAVRIDHDGNVGIGTTSPRGKLDIVGNTDNDADFLIIQDDDTTAGSSRPSVRFRSNTAQIGQIVALNGKMRFSSGTTEDSMLEILDNGNVGIGTTSPTSYTGYTTLQIDGANGSVFRMDRDDNAVQFEQAVVSDLVYYKTITETPIWFGTNNTERMRIDSEGNIGIGTTSPAAGLQVALGSTTIPAAGASTASAVFGNSTSDDNYGVAIGANSSGVGYISSQRTDGTATTYNLAIQPNGGNVGINNTTPVNGKLVVDSDTNTLLNTVRINHTRSDSNIASQALFLDVNLSGADNTTADRTTSGIFIDLDSSADGDASNEHRIRGVTSDVRFSGFSDNVQGGYFYAESNYAAAKTAGLIGVLGSAVHDTNATTGGVSNMYGVYGASNIQDLGDVDNAFGGYFGVEIGTSRGNANVGITKGVEGHINIDKAITITYGDMMAVSGIIDNNEGTIPTFGNQYLFKGDYQGTRGDNAYGIYTEGDKHYFDGNIGIGFTNPTSRLTVGGNGITTKIATATIADTTAGASLTLRGGSPTIYFDRTGADPQNKILMDSAGLEFKTGTLDAEGDVHFKINPNGSLQLAAGAQISNQENTDIDSAAAEVVAQVAISYTAAFFDFVVKKSTNVRSGTVYACHDGTNVEFTETSTQDLGDTSDVVLSVDISGGNMRLIATVASDDWSVKSLIRAI